MTEDTSTSTTRLDFSSMTLCITMAENITMNMYIMIESTRDMIIYTSDDVIFSSPESSSVNVETVTSDFTSSIICLRPWILYDSSLYSSTASFTWRPIASFMSTLIGLPEYASTDTVLLTESSGETTTRASRPSSPHFALTLSTGIPV